MLSRDKVLGTLDVPIGSVMMRALQTLSEERLERLGREINSEPGLGSPPIRQEVTFGRQAMQFVISSGPGQISCLLFPDSAIVISIRENSSRANGIDASVAMRCAIPASLIEQYIGRPFGRLADIGPLLAPLQARKVLEIKVSPENNVIIALEAKEEKAC